jgi:8-oxo-dGTP pyrophosphatase MutT (NUDIX family)
MFTFAPDGSFGAVRRSADAVAIATALLMHDLSIRSIEYEFVADGTFAELGEGMSRFQEAAHGFAEDGGWYADITKYWVHTDPATREPVFDRWEYRSSDGVVQETHAHAQRSGLIKEADRAMLWIPNIALFLGRCIALEGAFRMGELLLMSPDLELTDPPAERPWLFRLRGTVATGGMIAVLVVDVDPRSGFMPVRIENRESTQDFPLEIMTVTSAKSHAGVWLPMAGVRETFYCCEWKEGDFERVMEVARREGFPQGRFDPRDEAARQAYVRAVREVFGEAGLPIAQMDVSPQRYEIRRIVSLNELIPPEKFRLQRPAGARWADAFRFVDQDGNRLEDPDDE